MNAFLISLLKYFKITLKDLETRVNTRSFVNLKRPYDLSDFQNFISKLIDVKNSGDKLVIYGDYDVDGISATAILKSTFDQIGLKSGFYIPNRYIDGYGLTKTRIDDFKSKEYKYILTVDNGISAIDSIQYANSLGIEVIVVDHHEPSEKIKDVSKFVFHQSLSKFTTYNCSAASLAYFIAAYLLNKDIEYFATLAGLAVFSDVMPMIENNLIFAKLALKFLSQYHFSNLSYLLNNKYSLNYDDLTFYLIPALNAAGRISNDVLSTNNVCRFLLSFSPDKVTSLGDRILAFNEKRKNIVSQLKKEDNKCFSTSHAQAFIIDGSLSGISGLLANRYMRDAKMPTLVLMPNEKNQETYVGSIRSFKPYSLTKFISQNRNSFIDIGGHELASGFTIYKNKSFQIITSFLSDMEKYYLLNPDYDEEYIDITLNDLNTENFQIYSKFMPFGNCFEKPKFKIEVSKDDLIISKNKKAVFAYSSDKTGKLVYFGDPSFLDSVPGDSVSFIGTLEEEYFNKNITICLKCHEYIS